MVPSASTSTRSRSWDSVDTLREELIAADMLPTTSKRTRATVGNTTRATVGNTNITAAPEARPIDDLLTSGREIPGLRITNRLTQNYDLDFGPHHVANQIESNKLVPTDLIDKNFKCTTAEPI